MSKRRKTFPSVNKRPCGSCGASVQPKTTKTKVVEVYGVHVPVRLCRDCRKLKPFKLESAVEELRRIEEVVQPEV